MQTALANCSTQSAWIADNISGELMDIKKKNILTAVVLVIVAVIIYVFAVIRAVSQ
jgi:hypothetical protein